MTAAAHSARRFAAGRAAWLGGVAALALVLSAAGARADFALFGSYWDNVARMAAANDPSKVRELLGDGHSPEEFDDKGRTGLLIAAMNGNLQIAAILIKGGAKVDARDRLGDTPLYYAVERNHVEMAQLLLDVGATVDMQNREGMTPLMIAASHGYADIVQALLAKGANVGKTDFTGRDALGWAADSHRPAIVQMLRRAAAKRRAPNRGGRER